MLYLSHSRPVIIFIACMHSFLHHHHLHEKLCTFFICKLYNTPLNLVSGCDLGIDRGQEVQILRLDSSVLMICMYIMYQLTF